MTCEASLPPECADGSSSVPRNSSPLPQSPDVHLRTACWKPASFGIRVRSISLRLLVHLALLSALVLGARARAVDLHADALHHMLRALRRASLLSGRHSEGMYGLTKMAVKEVAHCLNTSRRMHAKNQQNAYHLIYWMPCTWIPEGSAGMADIQDICKCQPSHT